MSKCDNCGYSSGDGWCTNTELCPYSSCHPESPAGLETAGDIINDTHGQTGRGWYGFDLDGTLAVYDHWRGIDHIGEPVKPMTDLMRRMHAEGKVVKIVTARVAPRGDAEYRPNPYFGELPPEFRLNVPDVHGEAGRAWLEARYRESYWDARMFVADWCVNYLGFIPEITHEKDHLMLELYDDRVKQVIPNIGILVERLVGSPMTECRWKVGIPLRFPKPLVVKLPDGGWANATARDFGNEIEVEMDARQRPFPDEE